MRKVVVTGMGMITALGSDLPKTWEKLIKGECGIKRIQRFDPSELETQIAAEVSDTFEEKAKELIKTRQRKQMTRATRMMIVAADEAVRQSGIDFSAYCKTKVGVCLGVVSTGYDDIEKEQSNSHSIVKAMANAPGAWISMRYGLEGLSFGLATACASSAYAISIACNLIRAGVLDIAIVGGVDTHVDYEHIQGFNQILAMSVRNDSPKTACRPFTKSRDGFVMGEGAGALIIEAEECARKRNATVYAELAGTALISEAHDITAPKNDGIGMEQSMALALKDAGIAKEEVDYINAHGTSTYLNDKYETMAIKRYFGEHTKSLAISSTKSMTGHTIGAAGAIEAIISIMAMCESVIPPTVNYIDPDKELDLDYVPNSARIKEIKVALSNSFGFGGHNASLVFKKVK